MLEGSDTKETPLSGSMDKIRHEIDRVVEVAWTQGERALDAFGLREGGKSWKPAVEIQEREADLVVYIELPGIAPESVSVGLAGNMLTIEGEKKPVSYAPSSTRHLCERESGVFRRSIPLPVPVNGDDVTAESHHGLLRIRFAKSERVRTRKIPVNVSRPGTHGDSELDSGELE